MTAPDQQNKRDEEQPWWAESSAAPAPQKNYGTAPLSDLAEEQEAPGLFEPIPDEPVPVDLESTRPLGLAPIPGEDQIELEDTSIEHRSSEGLLAAALRDVGRLRHVNQDHVYSLITTLPREESDMVLGLFVVADGMGGHDGGEIASRIAISTVARYVLSQLVGPALDEEFSAALQPLVITAVKEANRAIWEYAQSINSDMGTTCTMALVLGRTLYVGHVGDSRAYVQTPGGLLQVTSDHSAVGRLIQLGQLEPSEAREHPLRSQLYRTIGQQPDVHVDFIQRPIGDATHLLLGSDGLWGMIDENAMEQVLASAARPQEACLALIEQANAAGGEDNISAVVVFF